MLKINWFLFLRHHVVFGFWIKRNVPLWTPEQGHIVKWKLTWKWDHNGAGDKLPWHRCWKWDNLRDKTVDKL